MNATPRIWVTLAAYNSEQYLLTNGVLKSLLNQTLPELEVISKKH